MTAPTARSVQSRGIAMLRDGMPACQVGQTLGVSDVTVIKWRRRAGIDKFESGASKCKLRALEMLRDGMSASVIGKTLGVSTSAVCRWRKTYGIQTRTGSVRDAAIGMMKRNHNRAIADTVGVSQHTVSKWRKQAGIQNYVRADIHATSLVKKKALAMLRKGESNSIVAKTLGISSSTVSLWRDKAGIEITYEELGIALTAPTIALMVGKSAGVVRSMLVKGRSPLHVIRHFGRKHA